MNNLRLQRLQPILPSYESRARTRHQDDLVISRQVVQEVSQRVNAPFESLRLVRMPSLPIPAERCVPIMATKEQVLEYEAAFLNSSPEELQNMTVDELLQPYSHVDQPTKTGKVQFLIEFFTRIRDMRVNLDVAVVCNSHRSEIELMRGLNGHNFNYKATSVLFPMKRVYGVIVKTRKNDQTNKPVVRTDVDIVMVYDSAIEYSKRKLDMFQGATYEDPLVIHLSTMDTADIRFYNSPWRTQLTWNSKLVSVPHGDQQQLFYQHNRKQANDSEVLSWNEFVANQVVLWASLKLDQNFRFEPLKKKHPLLKMYLSFSWAHPRPPRDKNKTSAAQPIAIASPQQQNSTTNTTTITKKKKENVNLIPMSNANRFATASTATATATDSAPFTENSNTNVKGKGKAKAQISSSIPSSTSTPGSVVIDLTDMEVKNSEPPAATTTTMVSQGHSVPCESIYPDRLALLESTTTCSSSVPLKRTKDLDTNDNHYGTSGKRARDNTDKADETNGNSQDQLQSTTADNSEPIAGFSNETDDYSSFLQEALQQFQQDMLNISVKF